MENSIKLGKFSADLRIDDAGDIEVTIYDRDDTSIVQSYTFEATTDCEAEDRVWRDLRDLNIAQVIEPDHVENGPKIVGFSWTADLHCRYCTGDSFDRLAILWAMRVLPDARNVLHLMDAGYPTDSEGNLIYAITLSEAENMRDTDEDQNVPRCGDCGIALCEALPVVQVDLVGFEDEDED